MTVKELIAVLQSLEIEDDRPVVIDGYEGGLCVVTGTMPLRMAINVYQNSYSGQHEKECNLCGCDEPTKIVDAIYLKSTRDHSEREKGRLV